MFISLGKYKVIIIFVCLCIISLILSWSTVGKANAPALYNNSLKHNFSVLLIPAYLCSSVISAISTRIIYLGSIFISICQRPVDKTQLESLESEVENLKQQLDAEIDRNKRLEELYKLYTNLSTGTTVRPNRAPTETGAAANAETDTSVGTRSHNFKLALAEVIAVEPTDWFRYLTIDKGTSDGVGIDMAVITKPDSIIDTQHLTGAVVGRIADVKPHSASVQLITDRLSVVAVTIESLGDLVLLRGQPEAENCAIDEIPSTMYDVLTANASGYKVISDERSSIFPPGMLVGEISSIKKGTHFCRVEVQPAFKFNKLREVMVVLDD